MTRLLPKWRWNGDISYQCSTIIRFFGSHFCSSSWPLWPLVNIAPKPTSDLSSVVVQSTLKFYRWVVFPVPPLLRLTLPPISRPFWRAVRQTGLLAAVRVDCDWYVTTSYRSIHQHLHNLLILFSAGSIWWQVRMPELHLCSQWDVRWQWVWHLWWDCCWRCLWMSTWFTDEEGCHRGDGYQRQQCPLSLWALWTVYGRRKCPMPSQLPPHLRQLVWVSAWEVHRRRRTVFATASSSLCRHSTAVCYHSISH